MLLESTPSDGPNPLIEAFDRAETIYPVQYKGIFTCVFGCKQRAEPCASAKCERLVCKRCAVFKRNGRINKRFCSLECRNNG